MEFRFRIEGATEEFVFDGAKLARGNATVEKLRNDMLAKPGATEELVDRELGVRFFDALNRFGEGYVKQMSAVLQHIFQTRDELSGSYKNAVAGNPVSSAELQAKFDSLAADMAKLKSPEKALNDAGDIELPLRTQERVDPVSGLRRSSRRRVSAFSKSDFEEYLDEITEGTNTASPSDKDRLNSADPYLAAESLEPVGARLSSRDVWQPPPGAPARPPLNAPVPVRLAWLRGRLRLHVEAAIERYRNEGLTPNQEAAVANRAQMERTFRGSRIDQFAKDSILQDPELAQIITAPDFVNEPDILDSVYPSWFDITTQNQWQAHLKTYGERYIRANGNLLPTN